MEKRKIWDITYWPKDYFSPERVYERVVDWKCDSTLGPLNEGWRVKDLAEKTSRKQISKSHIRFFDIMKNNRFP